MRDAPRELSDSRQLLCLTQNLLGLREDRGMFFLLSDLARAAIDFAVIGYGYPGKPTPTPRPCVGNGSRNVAQARPSQWRAATPPGSSEELPGE